MLMAGLQSDLRVFREYSPSFQTWPDVVVGAARSRHGWGWGVGPPSRVTHISMFSSLHSECRHFHGDLLHGGTSDGQPAQGLLSVVHLRIQGVQVCVPLPLFDLTCLSRRKCEKAQCVTDVRGGDGGTVLPLSAASSFVLLNPAHRAWLIALGCPGLTVECSYRILCS